MVWIALQQELHLLRDADITVPRVAALAMELSGQTIHVADDVERERCEFAIVDQRAHWEAGLIPHADNCLVRPLQPLLWRCDVFRRIFPQRALGAAAGGHLHPNAVEAAVARANPLYALDQRLQEAAKGHQWLIQITGRLIPLLIRLADRIRRHRRPVQEDEVVLEQGDQACDPSPVIYVTEVEQRNAVVGGVLLHSRRRIIKRAQYRAERWRGEVRLCRLQLDQLAVV